MNNHKFLDSLIAFKNKLLNHHWKIGVFERLQNVINSFSKTEKALFYLFSIIFGLTSLFMAYKVNQAFLVEIPSNGGSIQEGIVGFPRFINPILAVSDVDRDLNLLVYSGLLKADTEGNLIPDLAQSFTVSSDGLEYVFFLKENIYFHDGKPVLSKDVLYTIEKIQDPEVKSPRRPAWESVLVQRINEREIKFILQEPYAPFLENLTIGIVPKHIWESVPIDQFSFSQFNIEPIGSGPYKIKNIKKNSTGITTLYELEAFPDYVFGKPYISNLIIKLYSNEEDLIKDLKKGKINSVGGISTETASLLEEDYIVKTSTLPRIFGVFLNQNQAPLFLNKEVRLALETALDREEIINSALFGYADSVNGPIPKSKVYDLIFEGKEVIEEESGSSEETNDRIEKARAILEKAGWSENSEGILEKKKKEETTLLKFSISTSEVPELRKVAEIVKKQWQEIGALVEIKIFEINDLNQNVIRPRKFEALLFGEVIGRDMDFYPFWHSSQRNDPGLNIALYANITVDDLLEKARILLNKPERIEKYLQFEEEVKTDIPAIFIYSPHFIYVIPSKINNLNIDSITSASERFLSISDWYIETEKVWSFFTKNFSRK